MWTYANALLLCALFVAVSGTGHHRICALVLIANFALNQAYVTVTGNTAAWVWFSVTDIVSAVVLTHRMSGKIGAIIASTYLIQVLMHWSYGISEGASPYLYWQGLTAVAWLQLAILALGGFASGCLRLIRIRRGVLESLIAPDHEGMGAAAQRRE